MEVIFSPNALEDLNYWKQKHNDKIIERIRQLIKAIETDPFQGIGKPEPLKHKYSGWWSRRINREHRLVYKIEANIVTILTLREHY